ncbi:ABC transporter permease [Halorientalis salina]|uniref:ABC transporter permease n=1 Tax=Halorientalis salina TaxID=2932266 RepID=UPI0010ACA64E|nr:iron ABC transporter permease [Halorientalis salina]
MNERRWAERLAIPLGFVLTVAVLAVVFYYPVWSVFSQAVWSDGGPTLAPLLDVLTDPFYTGVAHYLFTDPLAVPGGIATWLQAGMPAVELGLFGFTAYQALLSTVASVALGLPGAYLLARYEFTGRETLRSLTILPFVLPSIMVAVGFVAMFGSQGFLNDVLGLLGLGSIEILYTLEIIVLAHAFYNAPLVTRLVAAAWESVDVRRVETARAMGASRMRAFRDVVLPELLPSLLTAALLTFIFTFMSFPIVLALGGLRLATVEVWIFARVQSLALAEAATLATIETVLSLLLLYVYLRYEDRQSSASSGGTPLARRPFLVGWNTLTDLRRIGLLTYGVVALAVFVGPLLSLVVESVTGPNGAFTTAYYEFLLSRQTATASGTTRPLPAIINSLVFGVGTLLLAMPMGIVVAVVATRDLPGSRLAEAVLTAPLAVSGVVLGIGLLQTLVFGTVLFGHRFTVLGPVAIVLAHAIAAYPFVTRNVAPALGSLDDRLVDAARSLGATRTRVMLDVELPLIGAAVTAGAAFAFAISVGEFDSTVLLASNVDSYTMPVALERYIGNRSLGPSLGPATAMATVLLAITAASFVVIDRMGGRWDL